MLNFVRFLREVVPHMRRRQWGRIVAIQSTSVKQPVEGIDLSNGIRPGIAGLAKAIMPELARDGITINLVLPGSFLTSRISPGLEGRTTAEIAEIEVQFAPVAATIPVGRLGQPIGLSDERISRGIIAHQGYWKAYGTWQPSAWRLGFVVSAAGEIVGFQELEGNDFPLLRTVDTSSFLIARARGRGYGKQMRRAVLALAFGPLQAQAAITSAWHDNHASLGVSRALGYQPNGESLHARDDRADVMVHMRLTGADWLASDGDDDIQISGFE